MGKQFKVDLLKKGTISIQSAAFNLGPGLYYSDSIFIKSHLIGFENDPDLLFISVKNPVGIEKYGYKTSDYLNVINEFAQQTKIYNYLEDLLVIKQNIFFQDQFQGYVIMGFTLDWINENMNKHRRNALILSICFLLLIILMVTYLTKTISKPLSEAISIIKDYTNKDGSLTLRLPIRGKDEFAHLAKALNHLADNLDSNILELNRSKRYLGAIFQLSPISIIIADTVGQIEKVNDSACYFFGMDHHQLVNMNLDEFIQAEDLNNMFNKIIQEKEDIRGYTCTLKMLDETKKVVELNVASHQEENNYVKNIIIAIIDITEKIQIQREILNNQTKQQRINDELIRKTHELEKLSDLNKQNAANLAELINISHKMMRFINSDDILLTMLNSSRKLLGADESIIFLWSTKSEKLTPYFASPNYVLDRILSEIPVGKNFIWKTFDSNESIIVNSKKLSSTDLSIIGLSIKDTFSIVSVPISEKDYRLGVIVLLKIKPPVIRVEELHLISNLANQAAILLDNRHLVNALEEKAQSLENAYGELQRSQQQVIQLQKMESLGTLVGGIAHDFNNILGIILPNTDLIRSELKDNQSLMRRLNIIIEATQRAADLTKQLLMFSRHQDIQVKTISPNQLVTRLSEMFERTLGKEYDILLDLDPDIAEIEGDENRLSQVLINLALNARDAMPGGGEIAIRTSMSKYKPKTNDNFPESDYVCISMTDSGFGIKQDDIDKIFDPFFTTKSVGKGTGLGLSVVYGIMQSHKGYVEVESEINEGTTLFLYFPPCRKTNKKFEYLYDVGSIDKNVKILIVDDEKMIRESVRDILESLGYLVTEAASGDEAIKEVKQKKSQFNLAIIDLSMPKLNGIDTIKRIKEIDDHIKIILSSGHIERENIIPEDMQIDGLLHKPYRLGELTLKVRQILS
jgi:PAS domain S-box-containing protein